MRNSKERDNLLFWLALFIGCLASSWSTRVFAGGFENALIPTSAALAILSSLFLSRITTLLQKSVSGLANLVPLCVSIVFGIQFYIFGYNPVAQVPTEADRTYGEKFIASVAEVHGDVLLPFHGYLPVLAGKRSCAHKMALNEIKFGDTALYNELEKEILDKIQNRKYAAIIVNANWFAETLTANYRDLGDPFPDRTMFYPVTGLETRVHFWFVPR
jgi:hypothetical protein